MFVQLIPVLLCLMLLTACVKRFKKDKQFHDLPAYSEKGLGVGGCFVNDTPWLTTRPKLLSRGRPLFITSYPNGDSVVLSFSGAYKDPALTTHPPFGFEVVLKDITIRNDSDLAQLQNRTFMLDGQAAYGRLFNSATSGTGTLLFGKVAPTGSSTGDGSPGNPKYYWYMLAGRFEWQVDAPVPYRFTHGRFDVTVSQTYSFHIVQ